MNISHLFSFVVVAGMVLMGLSDGLYAQTPKLPDQAKRIMERLVESEERELKGLEREILKKKKSLLKALERAERREDYGEVLRLLKDPIAKIKMEIAASERFINGGDAGGGGVEVKGIVDFNVVYHYDHPMEDFALQKGELTFFSNGKVTMVHKSSNGGISYDKELEWRVEDGELIFMDTFHGEIIISSNDAKKLKVRWSGVDKDFIARAK